MTSRVALAFAAVIACSSLAVWAEEPDAADYLRAAVESARTDDPELALALEDEVARLEQGELDPEALTTAQLDATLPRPTGQLFAEAVRFSGPSDPVMDEVVQDPRMAELRSLYDGGSMSDEEARERLFEILSDHGMAPEDTEASEDLPDGVTRDMIDQLMNPMAPSEPPAEAEADVELRSSPEGE